MSSVMTPLESMIALLSRLPGLGPRSGRRLTLHLLRDQEERLFPLIEALTKAMETVTTCHSCGNLDSQNPCQICSNEKRSPSTLCLVAEVSDLWAMERSHAYTGKYLVLGGLLSALDGRGPDDLNLALLRQKVSTGDIEEVIFALNATVEGQTTAHFLQDLLSQYDVKVTELAHGVPVGGELDYLDATTLQTALARRQAV